MVIAHILRGKYISVYTSRAILRCRRLETAGATIPAMRHVVLFRLSVVLLSLTILPASPARAALANPKKEDIDFIAEHVPESAMDARYFSLSTLHGPLTRGTWE